MASLYLSAIRDGGKTLALKPLTNRLAALMDPPLSDLNGYFLVEDDGCDASVLARVATEDAAIKLARILGLA
jgi:hypothetical protein